MVILLGESLVLLNSKSWALIWVELIYRLYTSGSWSAGAFLGMPTRKSLLRKARSFREKFPCEFGLIGCETALLILYWALIVVIAVKVGWVAVVAVANPVKVVPAFELAEEQPLTSSAVTFGLSLWLVMALFCLFLKSSMASCFFPLVDNPYIFFIMA